MLRLVLVAFAALLTASAGAAADRLPAGVTPLAYEIRIDPNAQALTFTGRSVATISVAKPVRTITLNAADLTIRRATIDDGAAATVTVDAKAQRATLAFVGPVPPGRHRLTFDYSGKIGQTATGLFATDYDGAGGVKQRMLVTQFEPADARRLAPLWDEPGFKTPFTLSVKAPAGQTAFSNMPVAATTPLANGATLVRFQPTPPMSCYLLFLGVGDVERRTVKAGKTEIGIITRRGASGQGAYALTTARRVLLAYERYFRIRYPLPKLDMIAVPSASQSTSAMENWGAVFYLESSLLLDPAYATENGKQRIFEVVAHELAHQWFGDLVTMAWWDDLWLNEGFASWSASRVADELEPAWHTVAQTLAFDRQEAMDRDARTGTHPIVQPIATPDQINLAFDTITYSKGEAVVRMLEAAVGPDRFRAGVRRYMAAHQYGSTTTDQLWDAIGAAAGRDVKSLMHGFTLQAGVPLITAAAACGPGQATAMALDQRRFGLDAASKQPRSWIVPLQLGVVGAHGVRNTTVNGRATVPLPGCGAPVVNLGQAAYARVAYADADFARLQRTFTGLSLIDQIGLFTDTWGLVRSGDVPTERYLALVDGLPADADPLLWHLAEEQLADIRRTLKGASAAPAFAAQALRRLRPALDRTGFASRPGESAGAAQLRDDLLATAAAFGDAATRDEARRLTRLGFEQPAAVPPETRTAALSVFAANATVADWSYLLAKARADASPVVKQRLYALLGATADSALATRALDLALTKEIAPALKGNVVQTVAQRHPELAFDFAVAHGQALDDALETSTRAQFVVDLAAGSSDPAYADKVERWAAKNLPADSRAEAVAVAAAIRQRAALRGRLAGPIAAWAAR